MKAFADDKSNSAQKLKLVLGRGASIVDTGEHAGYQHFLLFPHFFQTLSFHVLLKIVIVWKRFRGKYTTQNNLRVNQLLYQNFE